MGLVGSFLVLVDRANNHVDCDLYGGDCDKPSYAPWLLSMLAGTGATTAGWILFGTSRTKMKATPTASLTLTPIVSQTTTGAALTISF